MYEIETLWTLAIWLSFNIVLGFICRTLSIMAAYVLSYGQPLGWVKTRYAKKRFPDEYTAFMESEEPLSMEEGETKSKLLYNAISPRSKFIGLLDCPFCMGFWISIAVAACFDPILIMTVPIFTFYITERA